MPSKKYPTGGRKLAPKRGRRPTKARGPFAEWIAATGLTFTAVAEMLTAAGPKGARFSLQNVTNLRAGRTKPSLERAMLIERVSGGKVPADSWHKRKARA